MKILLLATVYEIGGLSNVIRNIMDNLDRQKFEVVFLVENLGQRHYPLRSDIKFINLDVRPAHGFVGKLANIFRHLYRIRRTIIYEAPDIVVGFGFAVNCLYLLSFLWPTRGMPKTVLGEYTEQLFVRDKKRPFKDTLFSFIYKGIMFLLYFRADAIVSVSGSLAEHIKRFFLVDSRRIKVIHVPVNSQEIRIQSQEKIDWHEHGNSLPCVGTISRLSFEKGVNYLIEAFSDLVKRMDARLIIVGDGKERRNLEEMARNLSIDDKVTFLGLTENPYKYLSKMDIFVLASLWEGFPTAVVESMVCKVPVIVTRSVGGIEELVEDGTSGFLVSPKETKGLSDCIYRLLQDKGLREKVASEAARKAEQFDSCNITRQYESLILSL